MESRRWHRCSGRKRNRSFRAGCCEPEPGDQLQQYKHI